MIQTIGWTLFGFAVWGLAILLHGLQSRFAPDMDKSSGKGSGSKSRFWGSSTEDEDWDGMGSERALKRELAELRRRVEVLETIVTDKKFQFDQELHRK